MPSVRSPEHRQEEGREEHGASPRERAQDRHELVPLGHVPGDDGEDPGERRKGDVRGERRRDEHEGEQEKRMQHARDRADGAGAHVRRGARDGAGRAEARRTAARRRWRRPAPRVRSSSDGAGRSCASATTAESSDFDAAEERDATARPAAPSTMRSTLTSPAARGTGSALRDAAEAGADGLDSAVPKSAGRDRGQRNRDEEGGPVRTQSVSEQRMSRW